MYGGYGHFARAAAASSSTHGMIVQRQTLPKYCKARIEPCDLLLLAVLLYEYPSKNKDTSILGILPPKSYFTRDTWGAPTCEKRLMAFGDT